jgi:hypothetical protein
MMITGEHESDLYLTILGLPEQDSERKKERKKIQSKGQYKYIHRGRVVKV